MTTTVHPYAAQFPLMPEADLADLAESIRANGLRQPIVTTADGEILDGRNRWAACERAGVEPVTVTYDGVDLAEYVIDANVGRRHMSTGARAMSTALVLAADGRRVNGRWKRGSVEAAIGGSANSGWRDRLKEAGVVLDHAPDLADDVVTGELALDAAYREACSRRDAAEAEEAERLRLEQAETDAEQFITERDPDLAAQVGPGGPYLTYTEALAIWEQRNREEAERLAKERALAERAEQEAEQRRHDTNKAFGDHLLGLDAVLGATDKPIDDLIAGWDPSDVSLLSVRPCAETMTAEGMRGVAARLLVLADRWEAVHG